METTNKATSCKYCKKTISGDTVYSTEQGEFCDEDCEIYHSIGGDEDYENIGKLRAVAIFLIALAIIGAAMFLHKNAEANGGTRTIAVGDISLQSMLFCEEKGQIERIILFLKTNDMELMHTEVEAINLEADKDAGCGFYKALIEVAAGHEKHVVTCSLCSGDGTDTVYIMEVRLIKVPDPGIPGLYWEFDEPPTKFTFANLPILNKKVNGTISKAVAL